MSEVGLFFYAFEVSSIQSFILEGGRLADISSASAMIDSLARSDGNDRVAKICAVCGLTINEDSDVDGLFFARRAGAAILAIGDKGTITRFRAAWTLDFQVRFPGLRFVDAVNEAVDYSAAMPALRLQLDIARNRALTVLPLTAPATAKAPRTGRAAVAYNRKRREFVDEISDRKIVAFDDGRTALEGRVLGSERRDALFPKHFDPEDGPPETVFPFRGDERTIAIIHADGNNLGKAILALLADNPQCNKSLVMRHLSKAVAAATELATQQAFAEHVPSVELTDANGVQRIILPARPILVGGDDVTMILRADIAIAWTATFLRYFEAYTKDTINEEVTNLKNSGASSESSLLAKHFGNGLSAGAGIAFASAGMPFDQLAHLSETLAQHAKSHAKLAQGKTGLAPSYVSFYRVTASALDDFDSVLKAELTLNDRRSLTANPYDCASDASLDALLALAASVQRQDFPKGPLRNYVGALSLGDPDAARLWARFVQVAKSRGYLDDFNEKLKAALPGWVPGSEPFADGKTPLLDLMTLVAVGAGS